MNKLSGEKMEQIGLMNYFVITGNHLGAINTHFQFTQYNGGSNPLLAPKLGM